MSNFNSVHGTCINKQTNLKPEYTLGKIPVNASILFKNQEIKTNPCICQSSHVFQCVVNSISENASRFVWYSFQHWIHVCRCHLQEAFFINCTKITAHETEIFPEMVHLCLCTGASKENFTSLFLYLLILIKNYWWIYRHFTKSAYRLWIICSRRHSKAVSIEACWPTVNGGEGQTNITLINGSI